MSKLIAAIALAICMINFPALSRVAPSSGTTTCEGRVEQRGNQGWYVIDVCSFDGDTAAGKAILSTCGVGNPCQVTAYGEWAPDFSVKRLISAKRIDTSGLNEIPEQYRGIWKLYRGAGETGPLTQEERMPVGTKGIGWLTGICNVTAIERTNSLMMIVKEVCQGRQVAELWSLRNLNGGEMLIVARIAAPGVSPQVAVYVRDSNAN
jgi:hypothetical protein